MTGRASDFRARMRARRLPAQQSLACPMCPAVRPEDCAYEKSLRRLEAERGHRPKGCLVQLHGDLPAGF